jgi:hypothetical protein
MRPTFDPFRLLLLSIADWLGQQQRDVIEIHLSQRVQRPLPNVQRIAGLVPFAPLYTKACRYDPDLNPT